MKQILTIILLLLALTVEAQKGDKKHERNGRFLTTEIAIPDSIKNYASRIVDNGQDLEQEYFTMDTAIVNGRLYGWDSEKYDNSDRISVIIYNPFTGEQESFLSAIDDDGCFEIKVPMTVKHQIVYLIMQPMIYSSLVATAGETVSVFFDMNEKLVPDKFNGSKRLTPYYSGVNVDLNYALSSKLIREFTHTAMYNDNAVENILSFSVEQYKKYCMGFYKEFCQRIDKEPVTKRAKQLLNLRLADNVSFMLFDIELLKEQCYRAINNAPYDTTLPENLKPVLDVKYYDFVQSLHLDDIMMLYVDNFGWEYALLHKKFKKDFGTTNLSRQILNDIIAQSYEKFSTTAPLTKKEEKILMSIAQKYRLSDPSRTSAEKAFVAKYGSQVNEIFKTETTENRVREGKQFLEEILGTGESYFRDFMKLQEYCKCLNKKELVPDYAVVEIEKMRFPFYADYVKKYNAAVAAKIAEDKKRGDLYTHKASDSEGDSLLVEILQDFKGKVVLIDFWATWCVPCRNAIKDLKPMEESFENQDVIFLFITEETSPLNEWENVIPTIKGHHYRLSSNQFLTLTDKWRLSGIPSFVLIGKDGLVKDFHTGSKGVEYYRAKIEAELKSPTPSSNR